MLAVGLQMTSSTSVSGFQPSESGDCRLNLKMMEITYVNMVFFHHGDRFIHANATHTSSSEWRKHDCKYGIKNCSGSR